jgi:long-chain fatty acid transport protein
MSKKSIITAGLLLAAQAATATNGYLLEGYGTNTKAQAGVGVALPLDSLTIATNPAGLTQVADAFTSGVEIFRPRRSSTLVQGGQAQEFDGNDTQTFYLPEIGFSRHINDRLAWGVALYGNGGLDTNYGSNPYARFGAQGVAGVDLEQAFLSPAVAFKINESNSLRGCPERRVPALRSQGHWYFCQFFRKSGRCVESRSR